MLHGRVLLSLIIVVLMLADQFLLKSTETLAPYTVKEGF